MPAEVTIGNRVGLHGTRGLLLVAPGHVVVLVDQQSAAQARSPLQRATQTPPGERLALTLRAAMPVWHRARSHERVEVILKKHGRSLDPDEADSEPTEVQLEHPALAAWYDAAALGIEVGGDRAGQPPLLLPTLPWRRGARSQGP